MKKVGVVIKKENGGAIIRVARDSACTGECSKCHGCDEKNVEVFARCDQNIKIGQKVKIESNTFYVLIGLILLFLLPVMLPLVAFIVFDAFFSKTIATIFCIIFAALSILLIILLNKSEKYKEKTIPKVITNEF